ncbi:MAG TPA: 2-amino-4-hydroxy-6-hydroxymethyldihydropteridine diphosphokinase [Streptosporangiaceae bacterium]|nr:2-amino-4-hydroxy-6-hydroxymethyldihydropteridine diphosphokinase [Streptosporangiaceae bacterium]
MSVGADSRTVGPRAEEHVVLALGSNIGDRRGHLQAGIEALFAEPGLEFAAISPVYETDPVGGPDQPNYLNAVLVARTSLPQTVLLERAQGAEAAEQRVRTEVWGPRTLDVDLIVYGDVVSADPRLTLPHPRAHERAFVLAPWLDLEPEAEIPGRGLVSGLLAAVGRSGIRRLDDIELRPPA